MIIVKLMGGMGNQMFQYAFGRYLSIKHGTEVKLDLSFLKERPKDEKRVLRNYDLDIFRVNPSFANKKEMQRLSERTGNKWLDKVLDKTIGAKKSYIREPQYNFCPELLSLPDNIYLEGYWQSKKYFEGIQDQIKEDFGFKEPLSPFSHELFNCIATSNSVCVNVRRSDFVTNPTHNICGIDYYNRAEKIMLEKVPDAHFFVFSDEVEWCRANLQFSTATTYVGHEYAGKKFRDYFELMSRCRNFIIPNSSFAWWATYLNNNPGKVVVAPGRWLNVPGFTSDDILLPSWIRLDV